MTLLHNMISSVFCGFRGLFYIPAGFQGHQELKSDVPESKNKTDPMLTSESGK